MSDVTSGMNVVRSVYLKPGLADLCGFTDAEVDELIAGVLRASDGAETLREGDSPKITARGAKSMMRKWYNGYRFALEVPKEIYNPTLVFYFLLHLLEEGTYPDQMLDSNLAADEGKLDYLAAAASGQDAVVDLIRKGGTLEIFQLRDRFTLRVMLERSAQDASFLGSYLYYFGMLTLRRERTNAKTLELVVPNEVTRGLYLERIRQILMPEGASRTAADEILFAFLRGGEIEPLLDFVEATLFPAFSNRDARWANELTLKTIFLTLLWNEVSYISHSEPELEHGYADLCLLRRPDARASSLWDLLFELKRLSLAEVGMTGKEVRALAREELMGVGKVREALDEAEAQAAEYGSALGRRYGEALKLRGFAVVAVGFERLVAKTVE